MSDLTERLFKHANDIINDWQGTADDWEAYARRTDAICAEAARDIQRLTRELAEAREVIRRYGDKMRMSFAPPELQPAIDEAIAVRDLKEKP